eukprot:m.115941 g.115941  ORF g.115941 m.115941 type:complete len:160 (-) comp17159_c0_seq9:326-805(-)
MILQASVQPYVCTTTLLPLVLVIVLVIETNGGEQNACVERQHENSLVKKASWIKFAEEKNGLSKMLQATTAWGSHERDIADLQSDHPLLVCVGYGRTGTTSLEHALRILGLTAEHYTPKTLSLVRILLHAKYFEKDDLPLYSSEVSALDTLLSIAVILR